MYMNLIFTLDLASFFLGFPSFGCKEKEGWRGVRVEALGIP